MYVDAYRLNNQNVEDAIALTGPHKTLLDIGCWDGVETVKYGKAAKAKKLYGIEIIKSAADKAKKLGIESYPIAADKDPWPFADNSIDCIVSNQVVEHLSNLDHFFSEAYRVLAPGGVFINSTNNLSSWHNIAATILGFAPFDLTNSSAKVLGIGNPFAVHSGQSVDKGFSWTHKCIYTAKWFNDWQALYGFVPSKVLGAGYYPLPSVVGKIFTRHSAFFTSIAYKPKQKTSKKKKAT